MQVNNLQDRIELCKNAANDPLVNLDHMSFSCADFLMCNPPFYSSRQDMLATWTTKDKPPSAVCTGADIEMITNGGDEGFAVRIFEESLQWRERIQWYSCMLGKLCSVHAIVARLRGAGISNWAVTCLQAGHITKRWVVAWSYSGLRPKNVRHMGVYCVCFG